MKHNSMGHNRTGADNSPQNVLLMEEASFNFPPDIKGDEFQFEEERVNQAQESTSIGSIPIPMTLKGSIKASFNKLLGNEPELFLDKLGERLAFERSGVRLYEAAMAKAIGLKAPKKLIKQLGHIRDEEYEHMLLIKFALQKLGADPTAMTPCADASGVMGQGLMQVLTDPRTDIPQALNALLNIELIDNAAWELLIQLAMNHNQKSLAQDFQKALLQEEEHLKIVKSFLMSALYIE